MLNWGSTELIAGMALITSVVSLVVSWRSAHHSTMITTYRSATDLTLDIDHLFIDHPELRRYFYDGVAPPSDPDDVATVRVAAIAELMLDCFECIWDIRATYSRLDRSSWGRYILDMLKTAPVMANMYEARRMVLWYPALDELHSRKDKLDARPFRAVRWLRRAWAMTSPDQT